jgi:hypothetical protein
MTLDELMQRRRELALAQTGIQQQPMPTIAGGIGNMISALTTGMQEHQMQQQEAQGRQAFAQAFSRIDPNTGQFANPQDMATVAMLDPSSVANAVASMREMARQKESEAAQTAENIRKEAVPVPGSVEDVVARGKKGEFGDLSNPDNQRIYQLALHQAASPNLTIQNRDYLDQQNQQLIRSTNQLDALKKASSLLAQGVYSGVGGSLQEQLGKVFGTGDPEKQNRSDQFYTLVASGELNDVMTQATSAEEVARFQSALTDPNSTPKARHDAIIGMMNKVEAYNNEVRRRITNVDPSAQMSAPPNKMSVADEEQSLQNARDMIARGADPVAVRKKLADNGIDPGRL